MYRVQKLTTLLCGMKIKLLCGKGKKAETSIEKTHKEYATIWKIKKLKVTKNRKIIKKYMKEKHTMVFFTAL
jgi:hypothetical protein